MIFAVGLIAVRQFLTKLGIENVVVEFVSSFEIEWKPRGAKLPSPPPFHEKFARRMKRFVN